MLAAGAKSVAGLAHSPGRVRAFNIVMALLLALSLYPLLAENMGGG